MTQNYTLELIEEHEVLNFYSIHFDGKERIPRHGKKGETLTEYIRLLIDTSRFISSRLSDGSVYIVDKELLGNLNFRKDEKK